MTALLGRATASVGASTRCERLGTGLPSTHCAIALQAGASGEHNDVAWHARRKRAHCEDETVVSCKCDESWRGRPGDRGAHGWGFNNLQVRARTSSKGPRAFAVWHAFTAPDVTRSRRWVSTSFADPYAMRQ